ncbi:MAG: TIR domain-containing protein [Oscillospiraceae bacterium]|nr:TIR domain-containing protein [Oscillospiraceae bacterium]
MEYTYDAFISYRHLPADMAIAEKLQKLLERRKKKDGTRLTVFRDRSDLPTTSDLGADIRDALEHSRFLIVLCSRSYQESKWCMTELEYFRQLHGGNTHILPILLEGEPEEVFPQILRYSTTTVLDQQGNPSTVQIEVEPLGADVRAASIPAQLKKLRVEYLRIAAPILGVSFDQLYQRSQRRKRAITAGVIAALAAFAVYSIILITQITQRQKQLEAKQEELIAKQQELYQNESVRLANLALDLVGDNVPLSMLLAKTALPADLENPDYPLAEEAERAIRSAALQHRFEESSAYLTQKTCIDLPVSRWTIGSFYDNGNYFTLIDYYETWVYEAHTGKLIAVVPDYGHYFFDGINCYAQQIETTDADGSQWLGCVIRDTRTGRELNRVEKIAPLGEGFLLTDHQSGKLWVLKQNFDPDAEVRFTYTAYGYFDSDGSYTETAPQPEHIDFNSLKLEADHNAGTAYVYPDGSAFGHYTAASNDNECERMPEAYQIAYRTFAEEYDSVEPYAFSPSADGRFAIIHFQDPEDFTCGAAFWSMAENRLLYASMDTYYLEKNSGLVYHHTDNRLEVLEVNPDALDLPSLEAVYSYVSPDGTYGIACYDTFYQYSLGVYRLSEPGAGKFMFEGEYWYALDIGSPVFTDSLTPEMICATEDCSRIFYLTEDEELKVVDIPSGNTVFQSAAHTLDICSLAINNSGTRIAYLKMLDQDGFVFAVADPDEGSVVDSVTHRFEDSDHYYYDPYLGISDDHLLVAFSGISFLYDLHDLEAGPRIIETPDGWGGQNDVYLYQAFRKDGLLIVPGEDLAAQGRQRWVHAIIDPETGEQLAYQQNVSYNRDDFYYDDVSSTLIQRNSNLFTVQRRGESGDFEVIYTINPRHNDMELNAAGHASDGTWLVLQNEEYCEIYRLEDGELCYVFSKPDIRSSQLAVIDGRLYDFCLGGSVGIPLPTTGESQDYVREALVYQGVTRTLTDREMQDYYIPSNWQDK